MRRNQSRGAGGRGQTKASVEDEDVGDGEDGGDGDGARGFLPSSSAGIKTWLSIRVLGAGVAECGVAECGVVVEDLVALDDEVFYVELLLWLEALVADFSVVAVYLLSFGTVVVSFGS
ncbi:hypothetical protein SUGI_0867940 [Cryptomeria japonica]|nr:hypothetical protein SUGI_0867940 [Cryptomeria japonica]